MKIYDVTDFSCDNKRLQPIKKCNGYSAELNNFFPGYIEVSLKYKGKEFMKYEDVIELWTKGNNVFFKRG